MLQNIEYEGPVKPISQEIDAMKYRPFDKIVFKECDSKCNCVDCGKGEGLEL